MHPSSRYAALAGSLSQDGDEEYYELAAVPSTSKTASRPRVPTSKLFMPRRYTKALNDYLKGKPSTEEDSDSDILSESGVMESDKLSMKQNNDSLEMLLKQKKAREAGVHLAEEDDVDNVRSSYLQGEEGDLEAQPAWMRDPSSSENNILRRRVTIPTIILIMLVVVSAFLAGQKTLQSAFQGRYQGAKKRMTLDDYFYGTFYPETKQINWLAEAGDGVYSYKLQDNSIMLHDLNTNTTRRLVEGSKILNAYGIRLDYSTFSVSPDLRYILFGADRDPLYRWSSRSNFWIHDLEHSTTTPLLPQSSPPRTAIAKWAPKGHSIAFVQDNDLYISTLTSDAGSPTNSSIIRITSNGNETIFNGVPDWVYEEEVFSSDSASWWSPDGTKLAFVSFDESEVEVYSYPMYNPGEARPGGLAYPKAMNMRYPKPGTPNPKITLRLFDLAAYTTSFIASSSTYILETEQPMDEHDRVLTEVVWVDDDDLIIKETNRAASRERVVYFDFSALATEGPQHGIVTRDIDYSKLDGGWAEAGQRIHGIDAYSSDSPLQAADLPQGYLDIIPNPHGYMHLALFSPANSKDPVFLSNGTWEVDGVIQGVDLARKLIYFRAAKPATERHLYSVPLPTQSTLETYRLSPGSPLPEPTILTDNGSPGFYETSFSPQAGYYLLAQKNGIPWQKVVKADDPDFDYPLSDNANLRQRLSEYAIPKTVFETVQVNNVSINVAATFPLGFDASGRTKYPVLLRPYGGPGSQTVQQRFRMDWTHYLATEGYIILEIDGRGTGYMGRTFRTCIRDNLGQHEAEDQIAVAEWYRDKCSYIDPKRIGIQGWSYGGYLTAKVIETNSSVISLGISVAPVTDWRYYDSIYTERYMSTLDVNGNGYERSSVQKMEGFKHAQYMLLHGSGDDNVHYLNSAVLLDRLTWAQVRGFRFRMFTDSAHSMAVRGAFIEVYNEMTSFLFEKFGKAVREKAAEV